MFNENKEQASTLNGLEVLIKVFPEVCKQLNGERWSYGKDFSRFRALTIMFVGEVQNGMENAEP